MKPAGTQGFLQPIMFVQPLVDQSASHADLITTDGEAIALNVGRDSRFGAGGSPLPNSTEAPLLFAGYGLHLPRYATDDFAGIDVRGKIVVVLSGGPAAISGPVKSSARFVRSEWLGKMGARGIIALTTPQQVEIPWARQILLAGQPGMYLADPKLRDVHDGFASMAIDPEHSESLFKGSARHRRTHQW